LKNKISQGGTPDMLANSVRAMEVVLHGREGEAYQKILWERKAC